MVFRAERKLGLRALPGEPRFPNAKSRMAFDQRAGISLIGPPRALKRRSRYVVEADYPLQ
jgi:hypothetical protein